jgi:hypothetical protein
VFVVAIAIIVIVTTNWTRWERREGWQRTNDTYLQLQIDVFKALGGGWHDESLRNP